MAQAEMKAKLATWKTELESFTGSRNKTALHYGFDYEYRREQLLSAFAVDMLQLKYRNGYYTKFGEPIISGYPGYPYIDVCFHRRFHAHACFFII